MFATVLKQITAVRDVPESSRETEPQLDSSSGGIPLDEWAESIAMPAFKYNGSTALDADKIVLPDEVMEELTSFIGAVASLYRENPFHNFAHASHVTMSVEKLLNRIINADRSVEDSGSGVNAENKAMRLHKETFGLAGDPLAHFAIIFAALIHDIDHSGVANTRAWWRIHNWLQCTVNEVSPSSTPSRLPGSCYRANSLPTCVVPFTQQRKN
jgi:hypothetical protein